MKPESQLFDDAVRAVGVGRRLPDTAIQRSHELLPNTKRTADRWVHQVRKALTPQQSLPLVIVDFLDSPVAGAYAILHDGNYFIALTYGMVFNVNYMVNRLFCYRNVLPTIGNTANEHETFPSIPFSVDYDTNITSVNSLGLSMHEIRPRDPVRQEVADLLSFISRRFVIGHELRHIPAGHLRYGDANFHCSYIDEHNSLSSHPSSTMVRQAFEWDADRFAIGVILNVLWMNREEALKVFQHARPTFDDDATLLLLCLIACSVFFRLLDEDKPALADWKSFVHPPSRNRRMMLLSSAFAHFDLIGKSEVANKNMGDVVTNYIDCVELLLGRLGCTSCDTAYSSLVAEENQAYVEEIVNVWKSILIELNRYAHVSVT